MAVLKKLRTEAPSSICVLVALLGGTAELAMAGDWQITPRLSLEETYTDNVRLVEEGERGDFLTTITPGIAVRGSGARITADIDYNLERLEYLHESSYDDTNHQLQANLDLELLEDWLYFDTVSRIFQQSVSRQQMSRNTRGPGTNQNDVVSYQFAPSIRHAFGSWLDFEAEYSYQNFDRSARKGDSNGLQDSGGDENTYTVEVVTGSRFARTPARFFFESRDLDRDSRRKSKFKRYGGELSYVVNRFFMFTATGGNENNDFQSSSGQQDGAYWTIGGTWSPSARTTFAGNWGDRFYGKTFNINGSHKRRRLTLSGSYSEDLRSANQFDRDVSLIPLLDDQGQPVYDPIYNNQIYSVVDGPSRPDDIYVLKRTQASAGYELRRGTATVRVFQFNRESQQGAQQDERTFVLSSSLRWRLTRKITGDLGGTWRQNERSNAGQSADYYSVYPSIDYRLGEHATARLRYEYSHNDDPGGVGGGFGGGFAGKYTEHALSASLIFTL